MLIRRLARPLLATAFVAGGVDTLMHPEGRAKAAAALPDGVAAKLPADPGTLVRVNAATQVVGGVLLALGKAPRLAALALVVTVVPSTVTEQDFWAEADPERRAAKRVGFLKDLSLLGGLMIATADTEGKPSLGWRGRRAARGAAAAVSAALPLGTSSAGPTRDELMERLHHAAERGRSLAGTAAEKGAEFTEVAKERGTTWAEQAKEHGPEWVEYAKGLGADLAERGSELADRAKLADRGAEFADRGSELAATARKRGSKLAETARDRIEERLGH